AGSAAALDQDDTTPAFVPDVPGTYQFSVRATDALGNTSAQVTATLFSSSCGVNPVLASISPAGSPQVPATVNTPLALTATVTDADNSACPARFAVATGQEWSVLTAPA